MQSLKVLKSLCLSPEILGCLKAVHKLEGACLKGPFSHKLQPLPEYNRTNASDDIQKRYLEALALVHESNPPLPFTLETLFKLHKTLFAYTDIPAGHFKLKDNIVCHQYQDGTQKIAPTTTPAHLVPTAMANLLAAYHQAMDARTHDPLLIISLTLLDFQLIHPFKDGNGRLCRILSILLLKDAGFNSASTLNLDKVLNDSHVSCRIAIGKCAGWEEGKHNVLPWIHYFLGAMCYAHTQRALQSS